MNISAEEFHIHFISYANIPFKAGIYASDLSIDWGDGTSSILKEKQYFNIVHHYQQEGLFHIKISGHRISNLNVSRLNLVDLQLEHCPSLEYLNCSINELKELDLSLCPKLQSLYCSFNHLTSVCLNHCRDILYIDLCNNLLNKEKLDLLFSQLPHRTKRAMIYYLENPGSEFSDYHLLKLKNWD